MDICVLNPYFYPQPGGTEHVLLELYIRLAKRHNVTILTSALEKGAGERIDHIKGMKVVRLHTRLHHIPGLPLPLLEMRGLKEWVHRCSADVYHLNNRYQYFFKTLKAIKTAGKLAITIHNALPNGIDLPTDSVGHLYDVVWGRRVMEHADLITAVSEYTLKSTVPKSYHKKTEVIHNGVDCGRFKYREKDSTAVLSARRGLRLENKRVILNCGRLVTQKGQSYLIEAVSGLIKDDSAYDDLELVIIGKGPIKDMLMKKAIKTGLREKFMILSDVNDRLMPYYYNMAEVYAMPSLYEPAGLALMEAMASNVPCVASKVGGIPEIGKNTILYASVKDPEKLKARIKSALDNRQVAERMARKGRRLMENEHGWDRIAKQYEAAFNTVIRY